MTEKQYQDIHTHMRVCAACSLVTALIIFPVYIHIDVVRNIGMAGIKYLDRDSIIFIQACIFANAVLLLAPAFVFCRNTKQNWQRALLPFIVSLVYPWSLACLLAPFATNSDDRWYRGWLNAFMLFTLPLFTWLMSWASLYLLQKRKSL